jgi:hypothetical protein
VLPELQLEISLSASGIMVCQSSLPITAGRYFWALDNQIRRGEAIQVFALKPCDGTPGYWQCRTAVGQVISLSKKDFLRPVLPNKPRAFSCPIEDILKPD